MWMREACLFSHPGWCVYNGALEISQSRDLAPGGSYLWACILRLDKFLGKMGIGLDLHSRCTAWPQWDDAIGHIIMKPSWAILKPYQTWEHRGQSRQAVSLLVSSKHAGLLNLAATEMALLLRMCILLFLCFCSWPRFGR